MRGLLQLLGMLLLAAGLAGACSAAVQEAKGTIAFSHHVHTEQGLACGDCHGAVLADVEQKERAVPRMADCGGCHDIQDEAGCAKCHKSTEAPATWPQAKESHLLFSHRLHADRGTDCAGCHAGADHWPSVEAKPASGPRHAECATCHQQALDAGNCRMCHERLDLHAGKPEQLYSHEEGFFARHGVKAEGGGETCAQCHEQTFCADCHAGTMTVRPSVRYPERVDRTLIHEGDWLTRHSMEAHLRDSGCRKCHGTTFCAACHERSGVGGALGKYNPHASDPSWASTNGASGHGRAARRSIGECAACHDQGPASNCIRCHSPRGVHAYNPHPPGWDPKVPLSERGKDPTCRICHSI